MRISDWSSDVCSSDLLANRVGPLLAHIVDEEVGCLVAENQRAHGEGRAFERRQAGPHVDAVDQEDGQPAEQDRQHHAAKDHRDGEILRPDTRLRQLLLDFLDLTILKDLELAEERSEEHTSELQSLMRISYAVFCLK